MSKAKKFKKLCLQYSYLKMEEEEVNEICALVGQEMQEHIKNEYPEYYEAIYHFMPDVHPEVSATEKLIAEVIDETKNDKNKDLKKLYREIAKQTHPDKEDSNSNLFKESAQAYASNDMGKMLQIASKTNIEVPKDISPETISLLQENILSIHNDIKKHKETVSWAWYKAKNKQEKEVIITNILYHIGATL